MLSFTEENYLKSLFHLTVENSGPGETGTNELAMQLGVKPATANDMLKKLKEKKLVNYMKYSKSSLTPAGKKLAVTIVRKHRLWETFLFDKLGFTWDEVHEVAEQLEHIQSEKLIGKLDKFLNFPVHDPHGDVIPTAKGVMKTPSKNTLAEELPGHQCTLVAVKDNSTAFLQYVNKTGLSINKKIKVVSRELYDGQIEIEVDGKKNRISHRFAENIIVDCKICFERK
ncbi:MAG: metal-dependent transcriptional regulator [Ferruginibacter sp.]